MYRILNSITLIRSWRYESWSRTGALDSSNCHDTTVSNSSHVYFMYVCVYVWLLWVIRGWLMRWYAWRSYVLHELHEKYELWTLYVTEFIWLLSWPCYDDLCGHYEHDKEWMMYVYWEYDELYLYTWLCTYGYRAWKRTCI